MSDEVVHAFENAVLSFERVLSNNHIEFLRVEFFFSFQFSLSLPIRNPYQTSHRTVLLTKTLIINSFSHMYKTHQIYMVLAPAVAVAAVHAAVSERLNTNKFFFPFRCRVTSGIANDSNGVNNNVTHKHRPFDNLSLLAVVFTDSNSIQGPTAKHDRNRK